MRCEAVTLRSLRAWESDEIRRPAFRTRVTSERQSQASRPDAWSGRAACMLVTADCTNCLARCMHDGCIVSPVTGVTRDSHTACRPLAQLRGREEFFSTPGHTGRVLPVSARVRTKKCNRDSLHWGQRGCGEGKAFSVFCMSAADRNEKCILEYLLEVDKVHGTNVTISWQGTSYQRELARLVRVWYENDKIPYEFPPAAAAWDFGFPYLQSKRECCSYMYMYMYKKANRIAKDRLQSSAEGEITQLRTPI